EPIDDATDDLFDDLVAHLDGRRRNGDGGRPRRPRARFGILAFGREDRGEGLGQRRQRTHGQRRGRNSGGGWRGRGGGRRGRGDNRRRGRGGNLWSWRRRRHRRRPSHWRCRRLGRRRHWRAEGRLRRRVRHRRLGDLLLARRVEIDLFCQRRCLLL